MKLALYGLTLFLGVVLAVHLAMNAKVGAGLNNARVGNALFWCIGAVGAVLIGLTGWRSGALDGLHNVNPILLTAGLFGASLVFGIAWLIPQIGAGPLNILLIGGQIIAGMIMSNYGWLGSPQEPVTGVNILGVAVMVGGVVLATYGK
jgi:bacterial/archaeal transporter family-2 protein